MDFRILRIILVVAMAAGVGRAQSIVRTVLGGAPDGVPALSATMSSPSAVVSDPNGNVYVALKGAHQVVRIDASGVVWLFAGNGTQGTAGDGGPAKSASLGTPSAMALDAWGNLYIADSQANRVRRVGLDGKIATFAGSGTRGGSGDGGPALQATLYSPAGVAADQARNVYIADTGNDWIRVVTPDGTISRFAGKDPSTTIGGSGDPSIATNATLYSPTGLALDSAGSLYLLDSGELRIRKITSDGKIANYAGSGTGGAAGDGGLARFANLNALGIAIDRSNNLLIADGVNNRVRIVTAADGIIDTLAGNGLSTYNVRGLALNGDTLYFSDSASNRVRRINLATGELGLVAGDGTATYAGDGGDALVASLNGPRGLALDGSGRLYIADSANHRVRLVDSAGKISTVAGTGTATSTGDNGLATAATLYEPSAVAVDSSGNLYIAERSGQRIRKVGSGGIITTVAGTGAAGAPSAESGIAVDQKVNFPQGIFMEQGGNLLIADTNNNRIRRLFTNGTITTVAGAGTAGFNGDGGAATSALLKNPNGAAADSAGNLYIADTNNQAVRRVGSDGIITTIGGLLVPGASPTGGYNGDGSPATAYSLNGPTAILSASGCSVVIADTANQRIRRLWPAVDYTIATNPAGLQVTVDGQPSTTPLTIGLLPGTTHRLDAPSPQNAQAGTRYVKTFAAQDVAVSCGPARAAMTLSFGTQYALSVVAGDGGAVSSVSAWQDAGTKVTLTATPNDGSVFAGWEGACTGLNSCQLTMDGPKSVWAYFAPAQVLNPAISSGGVVGAGLSQPTVKALSTNAIVSVFGTNFAPAGTFRTIVSTDLVNGTVPTQLAGVCVLVGTTPAPLFTVTPNQINFQAPQLPASGTVAVQVVTACGSANQVPSNPETVAVQNATPELFYFVQTASGNNPVAAVNAITGVYVGSPGLLSGATFTPAKPGDVLTLYATGLGATVDTFAAGELPAKASQITATLQVTVGSTTLEATDVLYAGVTPGNAGLYQINIRVPDSVPDGDQPVLLSVNGTASPSGPYISVKR